MRKTSFLLIVALLISSVAYGSLDDRIGNHWSKTSIEEGFVRGYFPYLAGEDFSGFSPNGPITRGEFSRSLSLLLKEYNFQLEVIEDGYTLSREKMVDILGGQLEVIEGLGGENIIIPFKDVDSMDQKTRELLGLLYELEIIRGDRDGKFSPERVLSQAEAVIILQRVRQSLNTIDIVDKVAFKTLGIVQTFNGKEEIVVIPQTDKVVVSITKEFPTPGYGMEIEDIIRSEEGYKISFNIQKPPSDSVQLQVIAYKTISLEIDKAELGAMPYNFILEGYNKIR